MKKLNKVLNVALSFVLMFLVIFFILTTFVKQVLLNADDINSKLSDSDYYEQLSSDLTKQYQTMSLQTSIPVNIFVDATSDTYELQHLSKLNNTEAISYLSIANEDYAPKTERELFVEPITTYIQNYAVENNIPFDENMQMQTDVIIDDAAAILESHTTLFNLKNVIAIPQFQKVRKVIYTIVEYAYIVPVAILVVAELIALLNRKKVYRALIWIGSAFVSGSLFVIIPAVVALILRIPQRITISEDYINTALRTLSQGYMNYFFIGGGLLLLMGSACLAGYYLISKTKREKYRKEKALAAEYDPS